MDPQERIIRDRRDLAFRYMDSAISQARYWCKELMEAEADLNAYQGIHIKASPILEAKP